MASNFPNTRAFVKKYGEQVIKEMQTRLKGNDKYASGKLYNSLKLSVKEDLNGVLLEFRMADYGEFVDKGVNGYQRSVGSKFKFKNKNGKGTGKKSKFIESLKKWCRIKGLPEGAAYPIRKNIWKYGIKPTQFFTIPTTRRQKQLEKGIEDNMILDLERLLTKELK